MDKAKILAAAKLELCKHSWNTFVDEPPSVAQGSPLHPQDECFVHRQKSPLG